MRIMETFINSAHREIYLSSLFIYQQFYTCGKLNVPYKNNHDKRRIIDIRFPAETWATQGSLVITKDIYVQYTHIL